MKIGLVLPELPQYSETFFNYKIKGLIENGHEITVFAGGAGEGTHAFRFRKAAPVYSSRPLRQGFALSLVLLRSFATRFRRSRKFVKLERTSGKSLSQALKSLYLNSHIIREDIDRLHFGFATSALGRENTALATGAKMSVSFRGFDMNVYPLKHPGCYDLLWNRVEKVHTISDYLHDKAVRMGLNPHVPFRKITPAIDTKRFSLKENAGSLHSPLRIVTVGRLNWIKDYETAVSAMKILRESGTEFTYDIIGDGRELERITFAVHQSGLKENVRFRGRLSHADTALVMKSADIYLQTSMQEGFCGSVLEAQATGLMCIVSDADGLKENVVDGVTGFIAERRKPESFAARIKMVLQMTSEQRRAIAMNARERVENEFNLERQKNLFNEFFESNHLSA